MKYLTYLLISFIGVTVSCNKPGVQKVYTLSQETTDFFVNYDTGTCWVFQDTLHTNKYDTIELVNKEPINLNNAGLFKGFRLDFTPTKSKNYEIRVNPTSNGSSNVTIDPLVSASGLLTAVENNNQWTSGAIYYDSLLVGKTIYHNVLSFQGATLYFLRVIYAKNVGLVSFQSLDSHGGTLGMYILVRIFKK